MVEVKIIEDTQATQNLYSENGISYSTDISCAIAAKDTQEILGYCLFDITKDKMTIKLIHPQDDIVMADSLLRSALFIAANRQIIDVFWESPVTFELIDRLGFVKNAENNAIDVTNLFSSCKNCENNN